MIRPASGTRSGITLTEILISILIMGVGIISLATLFPLGLIRLQKAQQLTRGGFLVESAIADLGTRNMLAPYSFMSGATVSTWFTTTSGVYNPFVQDTPAYGSDWLGTAGSTNGVYAGWGGTGELILPPAGPILPFDAGPGLPVAYDPLWRAVATYGTGTGVYPPPTMAGPEARFGQGVGFSGGGAFLRPDPDGKLASAHGLQRVTNFPKAFANAVIQAFVSPEDLVLQDPKGAYYLDTSLAPGVYTDSSSGAQLTSPSPIVPSFTIDPTTKSVTPLNDWRYTWFFTGQLSDASNGSVFEGDVVVCQNRPFGVDSVSDPFGGGTVEQVTGETVVEAVWGYSAAGTGVGFAPLSARRTVLLRWPNTMPDPDIRIGKWIADVTYERSQAVVNTRWTPSLFPAQRCYWYQIAKRTEPGADPISPGSYRSMTVWTTTPLRAATRMNFAASPPQPVHVEAALIMPSVVNVYPRTVYVR